MSVNDHIFSYLFYSNMILDRDEMGPYQLDMMNVIYRTPNPPALDIMGIPDSGAAGSSVPMQLNPFIILLGEPT